MLAKLLKRDSGVKVGPAKHGQGLYASKRFKSGQLIGEIKGTLHKDPDYGSNYCIDLGAPYTLEPDAPFRFLNHSCEPNAKLFVIADDDTPPEDYKVVVEAIRNIQPEAEITIDYEWPADAAIECGCGAKECRGWIVTPEELHLVKKKPR